MYKVIVADDDIEILEYIEHLLDWERIGFCVRGTATNGAQALKLIDEISPDLLITDITMPGMTGLELVRCAKLKNTGLKSIILTCHENFQYAKEALELGVQEYLVKYMLDRPQLETCVGKIKKALDKEKQDSLDIRKNKRLLQISAESQVSQLLRELIQAQNPDDFIFRRRLDESVLSCLGEFHTIGFCIDNWLIAQETVLIKDMRLLQFAIVNIIDELMLADQDLREYPTKAYGCSEEMIVVFWKQPLKKEILKKRLGLKLEMIRKKIWDVLNLEVSCVISACYSDIGKFRDIYQYLLKLRLCCFYPDAGRIVWNPENLEEVKLQDKSKPSYQLIDAIRTYEYDSIVKVVRSEYSEFSLNHAAPEKVIRYFNGLVRFLESEINSQGMELALNSGKANTFSGYQILTEQVIRRFLELAKGDHKEELRKEIAAVLSYLNAHLQDAITCEGMAQMINMNVSYFSKLFKRETGESFSDYLIRIRIERATMLLLHSDLTMEEITGAIGLSNMHYFHRLYKKQTGKTPGTVRKGRRL